MSHFHANHRRTNEMPSTLGTFLSLDAAVEAIRTRIAADGSTIVDETPALDSMPTFLVHETDDRLVSGPVARLSAWGCTCEDGERRAAVAAAAKPEPVVSFDDLATLILDALRAEREAARTSARFIYDHTTFEGDLRSAKAEAEAVARTTTSAMWAALYDRAGSEPK